eukprot:3826180-Rhodomonas_salina.3
MTLGEALELSRDSGATQEYWGNEVSTNCFVLPRPFPVQTATAPSYTVQTASAAFYAALPRPFLHKLYWSCGSGGRCGEQCGEDCGPRCARCRFASIYADVCIHLRQCLHPFMDISVLFLATLVAFMAIVDTADISMTISILSLSTGGCDVFLGGADIHGGGSAVVVRVIARHVSNAYPCQPFALVVSGRLAGTPAPSRDKIYAQ